MTTQARSRVFRNPKKRCLSLAQESVEKFKEILRELEVEFEAQRKAKRDLEHLKDGLLKELKFLWYVLFSLY